MSSNHTSSILLVTGASGHLGRQVVELLLETHSGTIIAVTRTPEKLADLSRRGVIVLQADFDDPASLVQAFQGVDRLLLISTDALDAPGRRINQHRNAIKAAEQAGVKHVVYTSLMNPGPDSPVFLAPDHSTTEEALKESKEKINSLTNDLIAAKKETKMREKAGLVSEAISKLETDIDKAKLVEFAKKLPFDELFEKKLYAFSKTVISENKEKKKEVIKEKITIKEEEEVVIKEEKVESQVDKYLSRL